VLFTPRSHLSNCLNTLLDRTLPLTEASFSEFGNPIEARADFLTIQSYAPYENVRTQAYPPMLILHSLNDARVPYWRPPSGRQSLPLEERRQPAGPSHQNARRARRVVGTL